MAGVAFSESVISFSLFFDFFHFTFFSGKRRRVACPPPSKCELEGRGDKVPLNKKEGQERHSHGNFASFRESQKLRERERETWKIVSPPSSV